MLPHKALHELDTLGAINDVNFHPAGAQVFLRAAECLILADDNNWDLIKKNCAAAHVAGRQRGIKSRAAVVGRLKPSRVFQAVHFGVQHRAAFLHSLIVSATDDCAIDHEHRPDRNSTCSVSLLRFYECRS